MSSAGTCGTSALVRVGSVEAMWWGRGDVTVGSSFSLYLLRFFRSDRLRFSAFFWDFLLCFGLIFWCRDVACRRKEEGGELGRDRANVLKLVKCEHHAVHDMSLTTPSTPNETKTGDRS